MRVIIAVLFKILILLRNLLLIVVRVGSSVLSFIWRMIPSGGSFFGIPGGVIKLFATVLLLLSMLGSCSRSLQQHCNRQEYYSRTGNSNRVEELTIIEAEPESGRVRYYGAGEPVAPVRITATGYSCLVELIDERAAKVIADIYVKDGRTEEVMVPEGFFSVRYAAGHQWVGGRLPFGSGTEFSNRTGQIAHFTKDSRISLVIGR